LQPAELFERWFQAPSALLRELPNGDGGFAVFMISIPLFERAIKGRLKLQGLPASNEAFDQEVMKDMGISKEVCSKFIAIFRNGFMHQAMGQDGRTKWLFSGSFSDIPEIQSHSGTDYLCIDPWKFSDRTLQYYKADPKLITVSESYPFADIFGMKV
jgi:hypothetical protein